jgi:hypothetical protein
VTAVLEIGLLVTCCGYLGTILGFGVLRLGND